MKSWYKEFDAPIGKVLIYNSPKDGATVVEIMTNEEMVDDTTGEPKPLRIYLNEATLYENPVYSTGESAVT